MIMSRPALTAVATSWAVKPVWPSNWSTAAQSETSKPVKPSSPLRTSVSRYRLPLIFTPFQLEYDTMMAPTPACTAARNGGRWTARSSCSLSWALPWSVPLAVPPSPM